MFRQALVDLNLWRESNSHKPLLLRGARQVGKTHLVRQFAKQHFTNLVEINFEFEPNYKDCFSTLKPDQIISKIESIGAHSITAGETILFLDEIQECPNAIQALRYFYETMPGLHVIGAGSLLDFSLRDADFSMPVGRVSFMYLRPMSFVEFLLAAGFEKLLTSIQKANIQTPLSVAEHEKALELLHLYSLLGGMPDVLATYFETKSTREAYLVQSEILSTYRRDFGKYASVAQHKYLQCVFEEAPKHLGEQIKFSKLNSEFRSRELSQAITDLQAAGLMQKVNSTAASGIPLASTINEKKFKLVFLDTGLAQNASGLTPEMVLNKDIVLLNKGSIAEQLVGQELLAYQDVRLESELLFWARDGRSTAELDYVSVVGHTIVPIEVKAGTAGTLKSLQLFMQEKNSPIGVRISSRPLSLEDKILSLPTYMIHAFKNVLQDLV